MTRAYREIYLSKAQTVLGDAFDYAVNACGISGGDFVKLFTASSVSRRMENGEPSLISGKSGIEIAAEVIYETMGRAVAYYQWYSARSYSEIFKAISFDDLQSMYYTLHEADISKFADIADERIKEHFKDTNLKRIRTAYGCTQAAIAEQSGVTLRSIQMYEQRRKDINKASAETLYRIAKALGCTIEDLIEK